jgi:serine/threonine protein kinase
MSEQESASPFASGTIIDGRYEILEFRGEVSGAEVYRGRNILTDEPVTIKILRAENAEDQRLFERFFREAKIASALKHEGIVSIRAFGRTGPGAVYMVMDFLEGQTLAELIRLYGKLKLEDLLNPISIIAEALASVHDRGIIHRNLKPDSIMLLNFGSPEVGAKIVDLGLARYTEAALAGQNLTGTGTLSGTPACLSPECCRGEKATAASDIYSFGCLLFEALTGKQPFSGGSDLEIMSRQISEPLSFPPRCGLGSEVKAVLSRCLNKDPAARYGSAREIAADLQRAVDKQAPFSTARIMLWLSGLLAVTGMIAGVSLAVTHLHRQAPGQSYDNIAGLRQDRTDTIKTLIRKAREAKSVAERHKQLAFFEEAIRQGEEKLKRDNPPASKDPGGLQKDLIRDLMDAHRILGEHYEFGMTRRRKHMEAALLLADRYGTALGGNYASEVYRTAAEGTADAAQRRSFSLRSIETMPGDEQRNRALDTGFKCLNAGDAALAAEMASRAAKLPAGAGNSKDRIKFEGLKLGIMMLQGHIQACHKNKGHLFRLCDKRDPDELDLASDVCEHLAMAAYALHQRPDYLSAALEWNQDAIKFNHDACRFNKNAGLTGKQISLVMDRNTILLAKEDWPAVLANSQEALKIREADPLVRLSFLRAKARALSGLYENEKAIKTLYEAESIAEQLATTVDHLSILLDLMNAEKTAGNQASARKAAQRLIEIAGRDPENFSNWKTEAEAFLQKAK